MIRTCPPLRWWQFTLRGFFVLLTASVVGICGAVRLQAARCQRTAAAALRELESTIYYDFDVGDWKGKEIVSKLIWPNDGVRRTAGAPSALSQYCGLDVCHDVVAVEVNDPDRIDQILFQLKKLPRLRCVLIMVSGCGNDSSWRTVGKLESELPGVEIAAFGIPIVG
jgi:hypothetical protein